MGLWNDLAAWRGPTVNCGNGTGALNEPADRLDEHRGVVLHIAAGYFEGTIAWQRNPVSRVSSHFVVAKDGRIAQMVDTEIRAWTQRAGNWAWLSIENEGFLPDRLTPQQLEANAQLLARSHREHAIPIQNATSPSGRGLGHHSMGAENGVDWGHSQCPGPAIVAQKPAIVARAIEIVSPNPKVKTRVAGMIMVKHKPNKTVWVSSGGYRSALANPAARDALLAAGVQLIELDDLAVIENIAGPVQTPAAAVAGYRWPATGGQALYSHVRDSDKGVRQLRAELA